MPKPPWDFSSDPANLRNNSKCAATGLRHANAGVSNDRLD
jgi:hypothetical protein